MSLAPPGPSISTPTRQPSLPSVPFRDLTVGMVGGGCPPEGGLHFHLSSCCHVLRQCWPVAGSRYPLTGLTSRAYEPTFSHVNLSCCVCWKHETTLSSSEVLQDSVWAPLSGWRVSEAVGQELSPSCVRASTARGWHPPRLWPHLRSVPIPPFCPPKAQPTLTYSFNKHLSCTFSGGGRGTLGV